MQYDLVFEGGGAKGLVFVGAIEAFQEESHQYDRLVGSSAGAITATLLAAGYSVAEMQSAMLETEGDLPIFATFMSAPTRYTREEVQQSGVLEFLRNVDMPLTPEFIEKHLDEMIANALAKHRYGAYLFSLADRGGIFSADNFIKWLTRKLDEGIYKGFQRNFSDMTLRQFYKKTNCDLSITGSDVTDNRLLILNHRTAPDLPLIWAVRMSMSIPFLWQEVVWQREWGTYTVRDNDEAEDLTDHAIVDGGLLSNFPIELLVSDEPFVQAVMGPKSDNRVLGFLIDDNIDVPNAPHTVEDKNRYLDLLSSLQTMQRLSNIVNTVTTARDKMVIEAFEDLVIRLPARGYGTTEFGMSDRRREALVTAGRNATRDHLDEMDNEAFESMGGAKGGFGRNLDAANKTAISILNR